MTDPLERRLELLMLLRSAPPLTRSEIIDRTGLYTGGGDAARAMFERDKRVLRALGVPIESEITEGDEGATRYTVRAEAYDLPALELTTEEHFALALAAATVHLDADWDEQAIRKLGGRGGAYSPVHADLPSLEALPVLHQAAARHQCVCFSYNDRRRELAPYGLLFRSGSWYVIGDESGKQKTFRVDRIEGDVEVGEPGAFEPPSHFDPDEVFPRDPLKVGGGESIVARVEVDSLRAQSVERLHGGRIVDRGEDGSVTVELEVANVDALRSWLLGMRDHARLLGPAELVDDLRSWLKAMVEV